MRLQVHYKGQLNSETMHDVLSQYVERKSLNSRISHYDVGLRIIRREILDRLCVEGENRKILERFFGNVQNYRWNKKHTGKSEAEFCKSNLHTEPIEEGLRYANAAGLDKTVEHLELIKKDCYELFNESMKSKITPQEKAYGVCDMFRNALTEVIHNTDLVLDILTSSAKSFGDKDLTINYCRQQLMELNDVRKKNLQETIGQKKSELEEKIKTTEQLITQYLQ